jgi:hypothetical protein
MTVAHLCAAVSDCITKPFDKEQHRSLGSAIDDMLFRSIMEDRRDDEINLRFAKANLTDWACAYLLGLCKDLEARHA